MTDEITLKDNGNIEIVPEPVQPPVQQVSPVVYLRTLRSERETLSRQQDSIAARIAKIDEKVQKLRDLDIDVDNIV